MMKKLDDLQEESAEEDGPKSKGTKNVEEKKSKKRSRKSVSSSSTAEKTIDSSDPIPAKRPKVDRSHVKNPFTKELNLSDDLAKFIGKTQESRCQVSINSWFKYLLYRFMPSSFCFSLSLRWFPNCGPILKKIIFKILAIRERLSSTLLSNLSSKSRRPRCSKLTLFLRSTYQVSNVYVLFFLIVAYL